MAVPEGAFRDHGFRRDLVAKSIRLDIDPRDASWKSRVRGESLDTIKQGANRVARRTSDSVTIREVMDERTTARKYSHRYREFSPWQLPLGRTPSDKCESPDLAQRSVEVVDDAAKQRFRVKEESYKAYIEELLSLRKRRTEFHQAQPWRQWAASERCCHWRSLRRQGARVKGEVFLGPARVLRQEREKTAESVRMQAVVWITEGTSLV